MKLEAVTVCVGYADFLAETLKHNRQHFDRWHIVTTPSDSETIELCRRRNLNCIMTDEFRRSPGDKFNKGRGICIALNAIRPDAWALHVDADIVLPRATRQMLEVAHLDPTTLYGCDRIMVRSWEEWQQLLASGYLDDQHDYQLRANPYEPCPLGSRIVRGRHGYVPIGFFQLWHNSDGVINGMRWKDYPDANSDAAHSDMTFALQWDRRKRALLPEFFAVHLESARAPMGANWQGRTTPRFGPKAGSQDKGGYGS